MALIPIIVGVFGILMYSIISMTADPNRPYFDAVFHNDLERFVQLTITNHPEHFQSNSTASTNDPQFFINNPDNFPKQLSTTLCATLIDSHGNNLFHWAAKSLSLKTALFLFSIGCDHDQGNFRGSTPFMWASTDTTLNPSDYLEYQQLDSVLAQYQQSHESWYNTTQETGESYTSPSNRGVYPASPTSDRDDLLSSPQQHMDKSVESADSVQNDAKQDSIEIERRKRLKENEPLIATAKSYTHIPYNPMILLLYSFSQRKDKEFLQQQKDKGVRSGDRNQQDTYVYRLINHQNNDGDTALHFAAEFLSISSIKTLLAITSSNTAFINREILQHRQSTDSAVLPHNSIYSALLPTFAPFQAQLSSLQSNYALTSTTPRVTFDPIVIQTKLHQAVTKVDENSPLHVLPADGDCDRTDHCKKAITLLIAAGFNSKQGNKYKRNLEHHISLEKITPLLSPIDEVIIAQFLGTEPPKHILEQIKTQRRGEMGSLGQTQQHNNNSNNNNGPSIKNPIQQTDPDDVKKKAVNEQAKRIKATLEERKKQRKLSRQNPPS